MKNRFILIAVFQLFSFSAFCQSQTFVSSINGRASSGGGGGNATVPGDAPIQPAQAFVDAMIDALAAHAPAGGLFISGGTPKGIFISDAAMSPTNGKTTWGLLGSPYFGNDYNNLHITWVTYLSDFIEGETGSGFVIFGDGSVLYYSKSAVATPDLASGWKNVSDSSPASIIVSAIAASTP